MAKDEKVLQIKVDIEEVLNAKENDGNDFQARGYLAIPLTSQTRELFHCEPDTDFTEEKPYMWIDKSAILEDIAKRKAVSDFSPFKEFFAGFPEEKLLLVYDIDMKYGEPFYFCLSQELRDRLLQLTNQAIDESLEGEMGGEEGEDEYYESEIHLEDLLLPEYAPPESKPWVSQGSEEEIDPTIWENSRHLIRIQARREHDSPRDVTGFTDRNAIDGGTAYFESTSVPPTSPFIHKKVMHKASQAVKLFDTQLSQTVRVIGKNVWTEYHPRMMSEEEAQEYLKDGQMVLFLERIYPILEDALHENQYMDIFREDWNLLSKAQHIFLAKKDEVMQAYQSFHSLAYSQNKIITCIRWHPEIEGIMAMSCADNCSLSQRAEKTSEAVLKSSYVLIWSFLDPIHPQVIMESPEDVMTFAFCPTNCNLVVGGTQTGLLVVWDLSASSYSLFHPVTHDKKKEVPVPSIWRYLEAKEAFEMPTIKPCAVSKTDASPTNAVVQLKWVPPHMLVEAFGIVSRNTTLEANQLITCSLDGTISLWDTRPTKRKPDIVDPRKGEQQYSYLDLVWKPFHVLKPFGEAGPLYITTFDLELLEEPKMYLKVRAKSLPSIKFSVSEPEKQHSKEEQKEQEERKMSLASSADSAGSAKPATDTTVQPEASVQNITMSELQLPISSMMYLGSEMGQLAMLDWAFVKDAQGEMVAQDSVFFTDLHGHRIAQMERSPFIKDLFLTVGGWKVAIWHTSSKTGPYFESASSHCFLSCAHWSSDRPSVFFVGRHDGNVEIWDVLVDTHRPIQVQNISLHAITFLMSHRLGRNQRVIGVGDVNGTLFVLALPWSMWYSDAADLAEMEKVLKREQVRLAYKEMIAEERRIKQAEEEEEAKKAQMEAAVAAAAAQAGEPAKEPGVTTSEHAIEEEEIDQERLEFQAILTSYHKLEKGMLKMMEREAARKKLEEELAAAAAAAEEEEEEQEEI